MFSILRLFIASAGLSVLARAAPCPTTTTVIATPTPPSLDSWYSVPSCFATTTPGAILKTRPIPGDLATIMPDASSAWNILYRTTDSHYKPSWAVTTLFLPKFKGDTPAIISYQVPYDSVDLDSSPSYAIYNANASKLSKGMQQLEGFILDRGWFLNLPDYEGYNASFAAGVMSGHAVIDSIRASLQFAKSHLNLTTDPQYSMWGYSGGAFASEWAAELQVQYAPEMNFSAAILGGLTPNITNVLETINKKFYAGLIPAAIIGVSSQYPQVESLIKSELKTTGLYNKTTFLNTTHELLTDEESTFAYQDISNYFKNGLAAILNSTIVKQAIWRDGIMGYHGVPQMPLYVYEATQDEISPIEDTRKLLSDYHNMGASIELHENSVGLHSDEGGNFYVNLNAFGWLNRILTGAGVVTPGNYTLISETIPA